MSDARLTIFAYDSDSEKRRRRIATILEAVAARVQRSVFEGWLTAAQLDQVYDQLAWVLQAGDHLRIYVVCERCRIQLQVYGGAAPEPLASAWIV